MVYKFFNKKSKRSGLKENQGNFLQNSQLADELHIPIICKLRKRKVYSSFKDNIWGCDLADMQLIAKKTKELDTFYVLLICLVNMLGLFL